MSDDPGHASALAEQLRIAEENGNLPEQFEERDENENRTAIAHLHLLGATVWAYGGGDTRVLPWDSAEYYSKFTRLDR